MITPVQQQALDLARLLVKSGVPVFLARPDQDSPTGYALPGGWQQVQPDPGVVDAWQPGWALCAVTGHVLDLVDVDPRSGGQLEGLPLPHPYLIAETPSGGHHFFVRTLGVPSRDGIYPGVDLKSGVPDGSGRGFAFIAPTVRRSKVDGLERPYTWTARDSYPGHQLIDPDVLASDHTGNALRARVRELRHGVLPEQQPRRLAMSSAVREWNGALDKLRNKVAKWVRDGWGGEAHAELLAITTHLARLSPDKAEEAFVIAFRDGGAEPDAADMAKMQSALARVVPDIVIPDDQITAADRIFLGGEAQLPLPQASAGVSQPADAGVFDFVTPERARRRLPPAAARYGAFGGTVATVYGEGVHWLQGESESGKTWVALEVLRDVLGSGATAIMVDYEDTEGPVFERLEQLGTTDEQFARLVYVNGQDVSFAELVTHLRESGRDYAVMVVDGVTAALSAAGMSGRNEQEVTAWADGLLRLARAAVCIDHVTKDPEQRNGAAIGSQAKKSVVTGTAWEVVAVEKFGRGVNGAIELRIQKDKKGGVRGALGSRKKIRLRFVSNPLDGTVALVVPEAQRPAAGSETVAAPDTRGDEALAWVAALEVNPQAHSGLGLNRLCALLRESGFAGEKTLMEDACRYFQLKGGRPGVNGDKVDWLRLHEMKRYNAAGLSVG